MKIEGEGIIFSEELYLNYLYQFGFKESEKYRKRTVSIEQIVRTSFAFIGLNIAIKSLEEIFKKKK